MTIFLEKTPSVPVKVCYLVDLRCIVKWDLNRKPKSYHLFLNIMVVDLLKGCKIPHRFYTRIQNRNPEGFRLV